MYLYETGACLTALAPAKLNLFFEVHGKRPDGFHEISSLAVPIRLFDRLTFEPTPGSAILDFQCEGAGEDVPGDDTNIVVRALNLLRDRTGITEGARIRLFKRIPSQAGLGGGSSDAAAAILAAAKAWKLDLPRRELVELAAQIGSDCPVFFSSTASLAGGRGERIEPVASIPKLDFVLLKPNEGLSTARVYGECMKNHDRQFREVEELLRCLKAGSIAGAGQCFFNRLELAARALWPRFDEIKSRFEKLDCLGVRMSGSGTTFFALCRNTRHAGFVAARLREQCAEQERVLQVTSL